MTDSGAKRSLTVIPLPLADDISQLWWTETERVAMMADKHIENSIAKIRRGGYEGSPMLQACWILILQYEFAKRQLEKLATFNKTST